MLFIIYMKLLGVIISGFDLNCHPYADDTQKSHMASDSKGVLDALNLCLQAVMSWMSLTN